MPFFLFRFLFLSYCVQYSLSVLRACCFNDNIPQRGSIWSGLFGVLETSFTWMGKTFLRFGKFLLLLYWIYYISLWLVPFLLLKYSLFLSLSFDGPLSSCIFLSQLLSCFFCFFCNFYFIFKLWDFVLHCSSLLEWHSTVFCLSKGTFYFQDFCLILSSEVFHIFVQLLFYIFCCLL
jgi:hypothetical protein